MAKNRHFEIICETEVRGLYLSAMRERLTSFMSWAVILSEVSHVFCCVLPTLFSVLTVLAGLGLISVVPGFIMSWHDAIHAYEIPIIATSAIITVLAWYVYFNARANDCHATGCVHEPCTPRKDRAKRVLIAGTTLFVINFAIFFFLHYLPDHGVYSFGAEAHLEGHAAH